MFFSFADAVYVGNVLFVAGGGITSKFNVDHFS